MSEHCKICGGTASGKHGVPVCNGDVVSNDFPQDHPAGTGTSPACERCHGLHARGLIRTCDRFYITPGPLGVMLFNGAGI